MKWFVNLSLLKKILIVSFVMLGSAVTWGAFNSYMAYTIMERDVQERNRFLAETAHNIIEGLRQDFDEGKISKETAQQTAIDTLRYARYDNGTQYFWISGFDGQAIMHPIFPEMEKQDISKTKKNVFELFQKFAKALDGKTDGMIYDYMWPKPGEDKTTLYPKSSYIIGVKEWGWVVGTGVYVDDLKKRALQLFFYEMGFVAIFAMVLLTGTYFSVRLLSRPMLQLANNMKELAAGRLDVDVPHSDREDEVGMIAKAFAIFKKNAVEKVELERRQIELQEKAEKDRKQTLQDLADSFESRTSGVIQALLSSSKSLGLSAHKMKEISEENVATSREVSFAINGANENVQTVAAATEQLAVSSQEIARQISGVAQKSSRSSVEAEKTSQEIMRLNDLADSIGDVVSAIKGIAEQTNLLALNATIEAARAGEAGKGFAVVADEVKKLATETATKTTEIDERVITIQQAIRNTVDAVQNILRDVKDIDHATATVASAVEQQNAATSEIGRNVVEASNGTQSVSTNIAGVLEKSEETGASAEHVFASAEELENISNKLQAELDDFLRSVRR